MATSTAAGTRASGRNPRLWILIAAVVAVLVLAVVLHSALSGGTSAEQRIGEQVYAANDCLTTVSANPRVARRWPQASKAEVIVCQTSESDAFANDVMDYAQFESASALAAALKTARPRGSYCTIGSAVVTLGEDLNSFAAMCAKRGGVLHRTAAG
jgi:hypothetical protein